MSENDNEKIKPISQAIDIDNSLQDDTRRVGRLKALLNRFRSNAKSGGSGSIHQETPNNMDGKDTSVEAMLKKATQMKEDASNMMDRELETHVSHHLSPEERVDAQKVAKEVWEESTRLLVGKDEVVRVDPHGIKGNLIIKSKNAVDKTFFKGAGLAISRNTYDEHQEAQSRDITSELWHFYTDHVLKTIRRESESYSGEHLPPKGLETEKLEADKEELATLLGDIKGSTEFKNNG